MNFNRNAKPTGNTKPCNCTYCGGKVIRGSQIVPYVNYFFTNNKTYGSGKPVIINNNYSVMYNDGTNNYLRTSKNTIAFALGKERAGRYASMFNLIGGSNDKDNVCGVINALREYKEEAKIDLSMKDFIKMTKKISFLPLRFGYTMVIFIQYDTLSLSASNKIISKCNMDLTLRFSEREMEKLTWVFSTQNKTFFDLNTGDVLHKDKTDGISSFAVTAINMFHTS